ncbi:MAG TPA: PaaX family transcriptional regulator C-terminal domain-containing protein [Nocardioidaceae bacterium]|nr:PaaX family transcriptional regulator C-terminal domain-containing protein [Nocardioidaceae bacterium]
MNARSALFDLFGDHLRGRRGQAPVAVVVRLLGALDIAPPAVRTAVSRMVRQGWLEPVRLPSGPGYALTAMATRRLDEAAARIYRTRSEPWDGRWHLLVVDSSADRGVRDRLRSGLSFLGYAPLAETTWLGAQESSEVDTLLSADGVRAHRFRSELDGDPKALAATAWDLDGLARSYRRWLDDAYQIVAPAAGDPTDEQAFAARSRLVHEWRKFLFTDPGLPRDLLPASWPGDRAASFFDEEAGRLLAASQRFVADCLHASQQPSANGAHR